MGSVNVARSMCACVAEPGMARGSSRCKFITWKGASKCRYILIAGGRPITFRFTITSKLYKNVYMWKPTDNLGFEIRDFFLGCFAVLTAWTPLTCSTLRTLSSRNKWCLFQVS